MEINIQVPGVTIERMKEICEHLDLKCKKLKKECFTVSGTDPTNFYWLGMNLGNILNPIETAITTTKIF
jgi:hypothetical protein